MRLEPAERSEWRSPSQVPLASTLPRSKEPHPGSWAEDIASALGTGTTQLRPALMKLKSLGAVEPKGKARATKYYAVAG